VASQSFVLALCFSGVFCLTPLAGYLIWLTGVNRRSRPTVVEGTWDFVGTLFGLSGFLIFGGGLMIALFASNARYGLRGNFEQLRDAWHQEQRWWVIIAGAYLAVVIIGAFVGLLRRRGTVAVYAVSEATIDRVANGINANQTPPLLDVRHFDGMCHAIVTARQSQPDQRDAAFKALRQALDNAPAATQTPASWFGTAALGCTVASLCSLALVILYMYLVR
jgi:hypothetical protein